MEHKIDKQTKNEHGLPIYPRLITNKDGQRVRVFNVEHEMMEKGLDIKVKPKEKEKEPEVKKENGWS